MRARSRIFARLVANGFLQSGAVVGSMFLIRHAFDVLLNPAFDDPEVHLYEMTEVGTVALFALALLACTGAAAGLRWLERVDAERLGQSYVHRVRLTLYDRMGYFSHRYMHRRTTGATMLRFVSDLGALRRWISLGLARIVVAGIVLVVSISVLAFLDPYLAAVAFVILVAGLLANLRLGPHLNATITEARRRRGRLAGNINEKIRSFLVIQAFDQQQNERLVFRRQSRRLKNAMVARAKSIAMMRIANDGATAISMGLVLSLGALEVFKGVTTAGNVVAAMTVVGFLSNAIKDLGRSYEYYEGYLVSAERIESFLGTRRLRGRSPDLPPLEVTRGEVELVGLTLNSVFSNISARIPPRARVALVGPNGTGKSTLIYVIARLIDPDHGAVLVDGQEIARCRIDSVRHEFGLVSPDLPLLRGTVGDNLRYRNPEATEEMVSEVIELCGLGELLETLGDGLDHRLEEGGANLSLGQRHILILARALLGMPKILLIDEIDANLDAQVAKALDRVIAEYPGTILIVTRAEKRLARMDRLWHLDHGGVLEEHNPAKLSAIM